MILVSTCVYRAANGILRPTPNALDVTFSTGAACQRLYSLRSTVRNTQLTVVGSNPAATISFSDRTSSTYNFKIASRTS